MIASAAIMVGAFMAFFPSLDTPPLRNNERIVRVPRQTFEGAGPSALDQTQLFLMQNWCEGRAIGVGHDRLLARHSAVGAPTCAVSFD
jgi:hypothetical protein